MITIARLSRPALSRLGWAGPKPGPSQPTIIAPALATLYPSPRPVGRIDLHKCSRLLTSSAVRYGGPGSGRKRKAVGVGPERETDPAPEAVQAAHDEVTESALAEEEAADDVLPGSSAFRLRPYQIDCVEAVLSALRDGYTRIGVSAPTGKSPDPSQVCVE